MRRSPFIYLVTAIILFSGTANISAADKTSTEIQVVSTSSDVFRDFPGKLNLALSQGHVGEMVHFKVDASS